MMLNNIATATYQTQYWQQEEEPMENRDPRVPEIVRRIQAAAGPQAKVTVIGSRARGADRPDSDLDIMVELNKATNDATDNANNDDPWLAFSKESPNLVAALENQYDIVIDGLLVENRMSLTEFSAFAMKENFQLSQISTDLDCNHPGQNRCGDCHVCGEHRQLNAWHTRTGYLAVCPNCWDAVDRVTSRGPQGSRCNRAPLQDQDGNQVEQARAHNQTCIDCYELQPSFTRLMEMAAQERNIPGPRSPLGRSGYYWLRYNI